MKKVFWDIDGKKIAQSVLYNGVILSLLLLLFEPTTKWDDYEMTQTLYGACSGNYSHVLLWANILWGYVIEGLLKIFPMVSWYYVTQYIGMFVAFVVVTYVLLKQRVFDDNGYLIFFPLFIIAYEFYIRITFTKTAGLMIAAGIVLLLYLIDTECKRVVPYVGGVVLVLLGNIFRSGVLLMNLFISLSVFIIYVLRKVKNKKLDDVVTWRALKGVPLFVCLVLLMVVASQGLDKLNYRLVSQQKGWEEYFEYNSARSSIIDYPLPDYETFKEQYEELDVSENDLKMWVDLVLLTNPKTLTPERMREIRAISNVKIERNIIQSTIQANKELGKYLCKNNIVFFAFLMSLLLLVKCQGKRGACDGMLITLFCLSSYYYLFWRGRTGHHVDVTIFMMGTFLTLYYCYNREKQQQKQLQIKKWRWYGVIVLLNIIAVIACYNLVATSSYYGNTFEDVESQKERYQENYNLLKMFSDDREHLYIMRSREANTIMPCFTVPQMIEKGFYHNIYRMFQYASPEMRTPLTEFNIPDDDPMSVITNDERIYYCSSVEDEEQIDIIVTYLREHFDENARAYIAKKIDGVTLYQFVSKEPEFSDISDAKQGDVQWEIKKLSDSEIEGYAYIPGDNSYTEKVYMEIYDPVTKEIHYDYTTQVRSGISAEQNNGKYAGFIWNNQNDLNLKGCNISIILKSEGEYYRIPIR